MKYTCEVCGCMFDTSEKCTEHEDKCKTDNQRKLYVRDEYNKLIDVAQANNVRFGVEVPLPDGAKAWYDLRYAVFSLVKNTITAEVVIPEKSSEGKANGKKPK